MRIRSIAAVCLVAALLVAAVVFAYAKNAENAANEASRAAETEARIGTLIAEADRLALGHFYAEAVELLESEPELVTYDGHSGGNVTGSAITLKIDEIKEKKGVLVRYEGHVEHIFFHSLIIYPELAFDDYGHPANGYNMWMATVREFKAMLPELHSRGYVLYPLNEFIEGDPDNPGKVKLKDIYLPPGKKPLVISVDDVNYYDYMKPDGFANRLVLGEDGRVWTEVVTMEGETVLTRDGDVMPILDDYVAMHPDFSWRGAKGTLALTGYQGALGYRITDDLPEEAVWQGQVKAVADALKADGWLFACHSYTHNGYFRTGKVTMQQMQYDTDRWKEKIAPWVGETDIYISPFGWKYSNADAIHRYIPDSGYRLFCPVGMNSRPVVYDDIAVMYRVNIDGYTMNTWAAKLSEAYFNVEDVIDPARPPLIL